MSVEAITWALRQPVKQSSAKFVLVVLANCASADTSEAFPSIAYVAQATGQDRKTVVSNLARLIEWGLIEDTGRRCGATKQIVVYRILSDPDLFMQGEEKRNRSENGTVPKTDGNSTVFPLKESQKRDTEPSGNKRNRQREGTRSPDGSRLPPDWQPSAEDLDFARKTRPELDLHAEVAKFRDYWHGTAGAKGRKADWPATWRNWIRRAEVPRAAPGQPVAGSTAAAPQRDWREPVESPLERELAWIRQQHGYGALGDGEAGEAERDRLIAEAHRKHGEAAAA